MAKIKSLNGLPNEVVQKYISTMVYYDKGYMLDWINKRLRELKINNAEIDLFNNTSIPNDFTIKPMIVFFSELKKHIENRLNYFGFETDFISQGIFKINISNLNDVFGTIYIQCILTTKKGKAIIGKNYIEKTYPIADSFLNKLV